MQGAFIIHPFPILGFWGIRKTTMPYAGIMQFSGISTLTLRRRIEAVYLALRWQILWGYFRTAGERRLAMFYA